MRDEKDGRPFHAKFAKASQRRKENHLETLRGFEGLWGGFIGRFGGFTGGLGGFIIVGLFFVFMGSVGSFRAGIFSASFASFPGVFFLAEGLDSSDGSVVFAVEQVLITAHELVVVRILAERIHGEHGARGSVGFEIGASLTLHFAFDAGGFTGPESAQTPVGDGHLFDEDFLVGSFGPEFGHEGVEDGGETLLRFTAFEHDGVGEESMLDGVAGGVFFAALGFWTGGFSGVGLVGGEFTIGDWHTTRSMHGGKSAG